MAYRFQDFFWEGNGFDEMRKYMKNGAEFSKDFEGVLSERAELENVFVKGLHKLIKKAKNSSKRCVSTVASAWEKLVALLEAEEEARKALANSLSVDCAKALKTFTDQQIKQREPLEAAVEKQYKQFMDKQSKQLKNKRAAFKTCRDLETSWEQLRDSKSSRAGGSDKDVHKLEKSCRKLEESLMKADREYRDSNLKTEHCRLGWESSMYQCCKTNELLEQERLDQLRSMLTSYADALETSMPPIQAACQDLVQVAEEISAEVDIEFACNNYGTGPNQPQQMLLDCYEEDLKSTMDPERRQSSLERKIQYIEQEIERQQKARAGVEQLAKVYQEQPDFVDEKGADDVTRQLNEADSLLNLLKANHYKLLCAHAEVSNAPRPTSQFGDYIETTTDKHGQTTSILKIPLDQIGYLEDDYKPAGYTSDAGRRSSKKASLVPASHNGGASYAGGEDEEVAEAEGYDQDDEFGGDQDGYDYVGRCNVLYEYQANESDELTIAPGDVINIIDKYDTEWWQGELNGTVGIFPASYVEDIQ